MQLFRNIQILRPSIRCATTRFGFVFIVGVMICVSFWIRKHDQSKLHQFNTFIRPSILERPLIPKVFPIGSLNADVTKEIRRVVTAIKLRFQVKKIPVSLVYHVVRAMGNDAYIEYPSIDKDNISWHTSQRYVDIMLNDNIYAAKSRYQLDNLLVRSLYGVQVASQVDVHLPSYYSTSHVGKYQDTLAKVGMLSNTPLILSNGNKGFVAETIMDEVARFSMDVECEWLLSAFSSYLKESKWTNRFGQNFDFEGVVHNLLSRRIGSGNCHGTHVLHSLATVLNINSRHKIISDATAYKITKYLQGVANTLGRVQRGDGSWGPSWADEVSNVSEQPEWGSHLVDSIGYTGHHLEWMLICPDNIRTGDSTLLRATAFLLEEIPKTEDAIWTDWHCFLPISHGIRALRLITPVAYDNRLTLSNDQ